MIQKPDMNRQSDGSAAPRWRAQFPVIRPPPTGVCGRALDSTGADAIHAPTLRANAMTPPASSAAVAHREDSMPFSRAEHDRMANAIRALAMDAVERAKAGHPGLPMGAADVATVLVTRFLKFDPADPT